MRNTHNANINITQSTTLFHHLLVLMWEAKTHSLKNKHTLIYTQLHSHPPIPPGQGPMGVCTEIGHLSHMMSRGRGCIIDEPKQHVSVSTHHTVGRRRKQQEVGTEGWELFGTVISGPCKVRQNHQPEAFVWKNQEVTLDELIGAAWELFLFFSCPTVQ